MVQPDTLLVTYTLFPDVWPTEKTERADTPWESLVARIKDAATYIDKAHCPLISMAEYGDEIDKHHKCLRYAENVRRIFGVEIDYDGQIVRLAEAAKLLQDARIKSVLYTSPSHKPDAPRWRVLLPLSEPAIPEKRAEYVGRANRVLGGLATNESFTLSQSFYIGRVRNVVYEVLETDGRCIDMAAEIEPKYARLQAADGHAPRDERTDAALRAAFERGEGRYEAMLKLSSRWAAKGMAIDDIETCLIDLLGTGSLNADGIDLRTRCRPMAESAFRKYGESRAPKIPERKSELIVPGVNAPMGTVVITPEVTVDKPARHPMQWDDLEEKIPPLRAWQIKHWLTSGPTLLSGSGGVGKTLMAQTIATALAIGRRFLDEVSGPIVTLFWACEDDHDELWRRQIAICKFFGIRLSDLKNKLIIEPRLGRDNTLLATAFSNPVWTPLRSELVEQLGDYKAEALFLDNVGQTFGGSENDRHHVTMFVNGLAGLVADRPFASVLMGHPAKQAGSEFSGSTAWENAVRMRWYMGNKLPQEDGEDSAPEDPNVRYLCKRKTNYTVKDFKKLTYEDGVFKPESEVGEFTQRYSQGSRVDGAEEIVIETLKRFAEVDIRVTDGRTSPDFMPKRMREMRLMGTYTTREVADAIGRLRLSGRIIEGPVGKSVNRTAKAGLKVAS